MDEEYSVPLQSLIDEFSFEPVCLPRPASEIYVKTTELNRPGLALSGFFELFEPERIQLIGNAEHCYLAGMAYTEIARFLCVNASTVWRRKMKIQQKYAQNVGSNF